MLISACEFDGALLPVIQTTISFAIVSRANNEERLISLLKSLAPLKDEIVLILDNDDEDIRSRLAVYADTVTPMPGKGCFEEHAADIFYCVGFKLQWQGEGLDTVGMDPATGQVLVKVNPQFYRSADVEILLGNPAKAEGKLGWKRAVAFPELVRRMAAHDLALAAQGPDKDRS